MKTKNRIAFFDGEYMEGDSHTSDGTYLVRSLYFDDRYNSCLMDNENSIDKRYKYRIRTYNNDLSTIHLEKKAYAKGSYIRTVASLIWDVLIRLPFPGQMILFYINAYYGS